MHDTYIVHNTGYGHMGVLASRADERHGYPSQGMHGAISGQRQS